MKNIRKSMHYPILAFMSFSNFMVKKTDFVCIKLMTLGDS
jgi:hypothetical protein